MPKLIEGVQASEPLGIPSAPYSLAVSDTAASQALSAGCYRVSLLADGAKVRFMVDEDDTATVTATVGHAILDGERVDIRVPKGSYISAIIDDADSATAATLEFSELL